MKKMIVAQQIPRFEEVRLDLSLVKDKVATWLDIRSGVEPALGDCMTSHSGVRDVFRESDDVTVARMEVVLERLSSAFSCSFRGHVSRS